ncbi:MAG: hypothetical protein HOJ35_11700 [Bdellovibrionales bacterium]|jgi:hypothetical protein|nr:hypothetical protein [Bdellovibrionales bacterium]
MKKYILLLNLIFISLSYARSENNITKQARCLELKDSIKSSCEGVNDVCNYLKDCTDRRDVCVEAKRRNNGEPVNMEDCLALGSCMKRNQRHFNDSTNCKYKWNSEEKNCSVSARFIENKEVCPGRTLTGSGLLGLIFLSGDTIRYAVDSDWNCEAAKDYVLWQKETCKMYKRDYSNEGCASPNELNKNIPTPSCSEIESFSLNPLGDYSNNLNTNSLIEVRNDSRDQQSNIPINNDNSNGSVER